MTATTRRRGAGATRMTPPPLSLFSPRSILLSWFVVLPLVLDGFICPSFLDIRKFRHGDGSRSGTRTGGGRRSKLVVMAVDRSKFRTCGETSFCRRHRLPLEDDKPRFRGPTYKLDRSSVQIVTPSPEATTSDGEDNKNNGEKAEADGGGGGGGGASWTNFFSRSKKSTSSTPGKTDPNDPYYRGPTPQVTAKLHPLVTSDISAADDGDVVYPTLHLNLYWFHNGIVRMRIVEPYDGGDEATAEKEEASFKPRWTADEYVLTEMGRFVNDGDKVRVSEVGEEELKGYVSSLGGDATTNKYMGLEYEISENNPHGMGNKGQVVVMKLDPFELHLFDKKSSPSSGGGGDPPVVSLNTRQLFHFEHHRSKPTAEEAAEEERRRLQEEKDKEGAGKEDRHGGKEIVGYWEDGLAIYADGSREEKPSTADVPGAEEEEGALGELAMQDTKGMWEETWKSHHDSKPYGPTSVGLDVSFPTSKHLYGLPEHASSLTLKHTNGVKGRKYAEPYRLYNLDVFEYELDETMALYGEVPLVVSHTAKRGTVGVFWFNPTETFVDVSPLPGNDDGDDGGQSTHWISESGIIDVFFLPGPTPEAMYSQYSSLTGYQELPPMFALGYHQCRWNYRDERDVDAVHNQFEALDYPYDVLWLDIEHTDGKRYFTWDGAHFPTPKDMQEKLWKQGRRMVTIIDPHIKRDNGYYIHKEATKRGLYIKDKDGKKDFDGWCWPGSSSYLDFTRDEVRRWWAEQFEYGNYVGSTPSLYTWNDMNEPSVFNGPEVSMSKDLLNLDGIEHREWHNVYGMLFHRATSEGQVHRSGGNERPFVLSRSFFAGTQKYGAIWTGDNAAEWSHLDIAAPMLLSLGVGGIHFVGADVGGFFGDPDAELMTRWNQAGAYQPFFRGHAHHDSKRREPWVFGDEPMKQMRRAAMARYALLPYLYTVFREAGTTGMPVMRPLWMGYPQEDALFDVDDTWLLGSDLLVKPVTNQGQRDIDVTFPTGDIWYEVDTMARMPTESLGPTIKVDAPLDTIPVYQRGGSIIPRKLRLRRSSELMANDPYTLYVALGADGKARGTLYMDDEHTFNYKKGHYRLATFNASSSEGIQCSVTGDGWEGSQDGTNRMVERIVIMGIDKPPKSILVATASSSGKDDVVTFTYHEGGKLLIIRKPDVSAVMDWKIRFE